MKNKYNPKDWAEDFQEFLNSPSVSPPGPISDEIFRHVYRDLNPSLSLVFAKLGAIHIFVGSLSLLLCSQFGMGRGYNLIHSFMGYSETFCMALCGALFLGLTTFVAGFVLSNSELLKIRKTAYTPIALLGAASLTVFFCFGADIALIVAFVWFVGAFAAGLIFTELSLGIRKLRHT